MYTHVTKGFDTTY